MTSTHDILNPNQAHILATLRTLGGSATRKDICTAGAISASAITRVMESLRERELVSTTRQKMPTGWSCHLVHLTPAGQRALDGDTLRRTAQAAAPTAPAPKRCVAVPILPMVPFYRNNGNRHIQSVGVRC